MEYLFFLSCLGFFIAHWYVYGADNLAFQLIFQEEEESDYSVVEN